MDVKETSPYLRSLAHTHRQAAFAFTGRPAKCRPCHWRGLASQTVVVAAVWKKCRGHDMVTSEGNADGNSKLTIRNQAQPFLKVALPAGASICQRGRRRKSARPGVRWDRAFVRPDSVRWGRMRFRSCLCTRDAICEKGGSELTLPGMDVPISLLHWEVFLPERYQVKTFGGGT